MVTGLVKLRRSAFKHGLSSTDILAAASDIAVSIALDDEHPQRRLILGYDTRGIPLELVVLQYDSGESEVIHAMKARRSYRRLLE